MEKTYSEKDFVTLVQSSFYQKVSDFGITIDRIGKDIIVDPDPDFVNWATVVYTTPILAIQS